MYLVTHKQGHRVGVRVWVGQLGKGGGRVSIEGAIWLGLEGLGLGLEEGAMHRTRFEGDIISLVRERKEGVYLRSKGLRPFVYVRKEGCVQ
jgi:hypothetical protein